MKTILVDAINGFFYIGEGIFKDMQDLLDSYPNTKIILTGANDEQIEKFGLKDLPYDLFTLKHDPEKTDPRYYELLLEKYNLKISDVIYFEHSMPAVETARSIGITTMFYDQDKRDLVELKEFLDSNL